MVKLINNNEVIAFLNPTETKLNRVINGQYVGSFNHGLDKKGMLIDIGMRVNINTPKGADEFIIKSVGKVNENTINVTFYHQSYELVDNYIKDINIVGKTRKEAAKYILANTLRANDYNIISHTGTKTDNLRIIGYDPFFALFGNGDNTLISRFGGEFDFYKKDIIIEDTIGKDNGYLITWNKNLEELNEKTDLTSVVTQIVPYYVKDSKRVYLPELTIDSNYIYFYSNIITREVEFKIEYDNETYDEEKCIEELRIQALDYFDNTRADILKTEYSLKIKDIKNNPKYKDIKFLYDLDIGDTVTVLKSDKFTFKNRVVSYEYDFVKDEFITINLSSNSKKLTSVTNNTTNKVENVLNNDGTVNADKLQGFINATKASINALVESSTDSHVVAMKCEVVDPSSPYYGSSIFGSKGLTVSEERNSDGSWNYTSAITAHGVVADTLYGRILAGKEVYFDLSTGEIKFKKGLIEGSNSSWNLDTGVIESTMPDGSKVVISPTNGFYRQVGSNKNEYHSLFHEFGTTISVPQKGAGQFKFSFQLPNEFKGKNVKAFPTITESYTDDGNISIMLESGISVESYNKNTGVLWIKGICIRYPFIMASETAGGDFYVKIPYKSGENPPNVTVKISGIAIA